MDTQEKSGHDTTTNHMLTKNKESNGMKKLLLSARLAVITATASFLFISPAFADQAEVLTAADANAAVSILKKREFCLRHYHIPSTIMQ